MTIRAFDFETHLIRPGLQLPPGVCMSFAEIVPPTEVEGATVGAAGVVTAAQGIELLFGWLRAGDRIVGANAAFDVLVSVVSAGAAHRDLLRLWVRAYEAGLIHDVFIRQKLLDLAAGCYRFEELPDGKRKAHQYNLGDLTYRHTRRRLNKPGKKYGGEGESDEDEAPDHWRLRFGELDGVPIAQYPTEAYEYALGDAIATAEVFITQETSRFNDARIRTNFPGLDPFADEARQTKFALPLKAMSAYGLRTDAVAVERFAAEVQEKIDEVRTDLIKNGLVREEYNRSKPAIVQYITSRGHLDRFTRGGTVSITKPALLATGDPLLASLVRWYAACATATSEARRFHPDAAALHVPASRDLVAAGLVEVKYTRNTKAAAARCAAAYAALGRPAPRTAAYTPDTSGPLEHICLDADACASSEDPLLEVYAEYTSLHKTLSNDVPMLRGGAVLPIHPRIEELLQTGRISASKPNTTNVRRLPGIRECFAPRAGHVYVDGDYGMLELHTLAQTCYWVLGYSHLGDALRAGKDPHLQMASTILGITYEDAKARRAAGDGDVDNARTAGKGVNFGRPGGLGKNTFKAFAWKSYRIRLDDEGVTRLLKQYDETWLEMPDYFRWVSALEAPGTGKHNVVQPYSGRLRAGATYCAACNSPFQGLGSDVAKLGLWCVWLATVGLSELGDADPLFGCHVVNFVHDSVMTEVPEARAHEAAVRQRELMDLAGRIVLPDVPVKADVLVTRQWSKKSARWTDANGRLIPWDMRIACRKDLEKAKPANADEAFAYLKKKDWPTDVAREAVVAVFGVSARDAA
jgi:hypothetical protein